MIDLCFALNGPHVQMMLPIVLFTLFKFNTMTDVNLHFVDKGCHPIVREWLCSNYPNCAIHQPGEAPAIGSDDVGIVRDVYQTMRWMADHCGAAKWVFIAHFDMEIVGGLLDYFKSFAADDVAQIGTHSTGLVGYNREELKKADVGFSNLDDCFVVKEEDTGFPLWKIRHKSDPRCTDRSQQISGWDVAELLELCLGFKGKRVITWRDTELQRFRIHNGSGCGRCLGANEIIRERTQETLKRLGLEAI